jgi:hypothetical protein
MTTSWALATKGQFREAFATHVSGTLLALLALAAGIGAMIVAVQGKRLSWQPRSGALAAGAVGLALLTLGEWIMRLAMR